jgi:hypothetical protein
MRASLASVFEEMEKDGATLASRADAVLRIVKINKITEVKQFSAAVKAAYAANGWNAGAGRPVKGAAPLKAVPSSVKQYVSTMRAAFRMKLLVQTYTSFYALRSDVSATRVKARRKAADGKPELAGVAVKRADTLNGALFHDLAVLFESLDKGKQGKMIGALDRIRREFAHAAPIEIQAQFDALPGYLKRAA